MPSTEAWSWFGVYGLLRKWEPVTNRDFSWAVAVLPVV